MKIVLSRDEVKGIVGKHFGVTDFILEISTENATKPIKCHRDNILITDENMLVVDKKDPNSIVLKEADPDSGLPESGTIQEVTPADTDNATEVNDNIGPTVVKRHRGGAKGSVNYDNYYKQINDFIASGKRELKVSSEGLSSKGIYWRYWQCRKKFKIRAVKLSLTKDGLVLKRA